MNTITLIDVRSYLVGRELDLANPANITAFDAQAKVVAIGLTGKAKPFKQDLTKVKTLMTTLWGQTIPQDDGIDDPKTEADLDAAYDVDSAGLAQSDTEELEAADHQPEASDEAEAASDAPEDEAEEIVSKGSVVKPQYRQEYKARGDVRGCGDWLHLILKATTLGAKKKLLWEQFEAICEANGVNAAQYATPEKRSNGWQGRARMSGRKLLEFVVARENTLLIPLALVNAHQEKVDALVNSDAAFVYEVEDDMAVFTPSQEFVTKTLASRKSKGEKEAL